MGERAGPAPLVVRRAQLEALDAVARARSVERTAELLRAEHGRAVAALEDGELLARVERAMQRARAEHGFEAELDLAAFAVLSLTVSPVFDRHPAVRAHLGERGRRKPGHMAGVLARVTPAEWQDARRSAPRGET